MSSLYEALQRTTNPNMFGSSILNDITPEQQVMFNTKQFLPSGFNSGGVATSASNYFDNLSKMPTATDGLKNTNWSNMPFSSKLGFGLDALNSALDAISAHRAYKLGKSQLNFQKDQFNRQFEAQKGLTNSQLYDRQTIRNIENPGMFMSASEYLDKYGVK